MRVFRDLKVWQKAHQLSLAVYRASAAFPSDERFGLTAQVRRAATSIECNIAEGCGRGSDADLVRFLHMAMGSASEVETQLLLARDLGFIKKQSHAEVEVQLIEVKKMLSAFTDYLKKGNSHGS